MPDAERPAGPGGRGLGGERGAGQPELVSILPHLRDDLDSFFGVHRFTGPRVWESAASKPARYTVCERPATSRALGSV